MLQMKTNLLRPSPRPRRPFARFGLLLLTASSLLVTPSAWSANLTSSLRKLLESNDLQNTTIALRLVDQGRLSLDVPLGDYLPEPWLPDSEYRDRITLRHALSQIDAWVEEHREPVASES